MFLGTIEARLDTKGRVFLPAAYRKQFEEADRDCVIVRRDPNRRCLVIYPQQVFRRKAEQLMQRLDCEWNAADQQLLMEFTAEVEPCDIDTQGRILLSRKTLQYLQADTCLTFIGMIDRIVVWGSATYAAERLSAEAFAEQLNFRMQQPVEPKSSLDELK